MKNGSSTTSYAPKEKVDYISQDLLQQKVSVFEFKYM